MFLIQKRTIKRQTSRSTQSTNFKTLKGPEGPKNIPQVSIGKWIYDHLIKYQNKILIVSIEKYQKFYKKNTEFNKVLIALNLVSIFC
jgi:hypothetical protein